MNQRGLAEGPAQAAILAGVYPVPDYWVSSPAVRAYQTARIFARVWGGCLEQAVELEARIYEATGVVVAEVALEAVLRCERAAVLFGHNPGVSEALAELCGEIREFKTCGVAVLGVEERGSRPKLIDFRPGLNRLWPDRSQDEPPGEYRREG